MDMTSVANNLGTEKLLNRNQGSFFKRLGKQWQLLLMSVPMLLYVFLFNYAPLWGWINAFRDFSTPAARDLYKAGQAQWVGFQNFEALFNSPNIPTFTQALRNTLAMSVINLVFGTVSAILLAILLNEVRMRSFKRTVQTVTYLPHFLSMVIVVSMAQIVFEDKANSPINSLLINLGIIKDPVYWLGEKQYFWWLVGVVNVCKEVGWGTIIYISAMTGIDPSLYEAAAIDGAGRFQRILHITLPGIKSTFIILLIMNIGHLLDTGYEIQYLMGKYGPLQEYSWTIDLYAYTWGVKQLDFGFATAAGIFKSIIAIVLLTVANFVAKKLGEDSLM